MKKTLLIVAMTVITALGTLNAQAVTNEQDPIISHETLSAQYGQEIKVLSSEIKTLKIKLKADKTNVQLQTEMATKKAELDEIKGKKATIDTAIKTQKSSEAAAKKAEKALLKAKQAQKDAEAVRGINPGN